jgi:transposase-like protein
MHERLKKKLEDLGHDVINAPSSVYICRNCGYEFYYSSSAAEHIYWDEHIYYYSLNGIYLTLLARYTGISCSEMIIKNIIE